MNEALASPTWEVRKTPHHGPQLLLRLFPGAKDFGIFIPEDLAKILEDYCLCSNLKLLASYDECPTCKGRGIIEVKPSKPTCAEGTSLDDDDCPVCGGLGGIGPGLHRMSCPTQIPYVQNLQAALDLAKTEESRFKDAYESSRKELARANASIDDHQEAIQEGFTDYAKLEEAVNTFPLPLLTGGEGPDGKRVHQFVNLVTHKMSPRYDSIVEAILAGHEFYKQNPGFTLEVGHVGIGIDPEPMGEGECDG